MLTSLSLEAQSGQQAFSPQNRDTEVTRITFDNYLKKWNGEVLLNRIRETTANYKNGEGITITVVAENAQIYMNVQGGSFQDADGEVMDTFFTDAMIGLQKERLKEAVKHFLVDFKSYLPKMQTSEQIRFVFDVRDRLKKKNGKELPPSKLAHKRTYRLEATIAYNDFQQFREGNMEEQAFLDKLNFNLINN